MTARSARPSDFARARFCSLALGALVLCLCAPLGAQDPAIRGPVSWIPTRGFNSKVTGSPDALAGATLMLRRDAKESQGSGMLTGWLPATRFRGRAARIRGEVLGERAQGDASLWLRIEGPGRVPLAEDYGTGMLVHAGAGWTPQQLVLPVSDEAEYVVFGLLLAGSGEASARYVRVDVVDRPPARAPASSRGPDVAVGMRSPLDAVREALFDGDTARAVELLTPRVAVTPQLDSRTLTDLLLLLWIGSTPNHRDALEAWSAAARSVDRHVDPALRSDAARIFRAAVGIVRDEPAQAFVDVFGPIWWRHRVAELAEAADADSLLAAAARWVLVLDDMRWVRNIVNAWTPVLDSLPSDCVRRTANGECVLLTAPPPRTRLPELFKREFFYVPIPDASIPIFIPILGSFGTDLEGARGSGVWPFDALSARVRVALATVAEDRTALRAYANDTAGLPPFDAAVVRATALAFAGDLGGAAETMAPHPEWFTDLDAERTELGASRMTPELFWRLAWPLYLQPYNERQVVHRTRLLLADVLQHGVGDSVGIFDLYGRRGPLVQRGLPLGVALLPRGIHREAQRYAGVSWVPPASHETVVRLHSRAMPGSLDLWLAARDESLLNTYSGYVAEHYDRLEAFEHQVVQYVRDGHRIVDIHAKRPMAPLCADPHPVVGFFLLNNALQVLREVTDTVPRRQRYRFRMVLAPAAYVYSLEFLDKACRVGARARYVLTVPSADTTRLSDIVLAENVALEEPARVKGDPPVMARPGLRVPAGQSAEFYWEAYGLDAPVVQPGRLDIHFEVVSVSEERVALGQLAGLEAAARRRKPLFDLQYRATVPAGSGPIGFGLSVTIPGDAHGVYVARVTVRDTQTKWRETARRALYVEPGD